ncbi:MAG: membrane protein insertion efficiency factor YidD [Rhodospirillaceae bacterium]
MRFFQFMIRGYQLFLAPIVHSIVPVQGGCRFHPSCSQYAKEAYGRFGTIQGTWLTVKRLGRCHPWGKAGYDPIPEQPQKPHHTVTCETHAHR